MKDRGTYALTGAEIYTSVADFRACMADFCAYAEFHQRAIVIMDMATKVPVGIWFPVKCSPSWVDVFRHAEGQTLIRGKQVKGKVERKPRGKQRGAGLNRVPRPRKGFSPEELTERVQALSPRIMDRGMEEGGDE